MSFGGNGSAQQTQSQSSTNYDPTQVSLVNSNAQNVSAAAAPGGALAYTPYTGPGLNFGDPTALTNLSNFSAPTVTGSGYVPQTYAPSTIDPNSIANVTAGQLSSTNLSPYMNPYTSSVIDTTNQQLARQNQIDNATAAGQATAAGAFGGSRSAVLQNLNTDSYDRALAATDAGLNQANFSQAQGAATTDIGNTLQANLANQSKGLVIGQANQGALNTAAQTNAGWLNSARQFNATQTQAADTANQQAALASAQTRLQALGLNENQAQALFGANWAEYLNSQTDPQAVQALVNQAYGIVPTGPLSQSTSSGSGGSVGLKVGV